MKTIKFFTILIWSFLPGNQTIVHAVTRDGGERKRTSIGYEILRSSSQLCSLGGERAVEADISK